MRKYKLLSVLFAAAAILLSDGMCAVVAYNWCAMWWGNRYGGWSGAPEQYALLYAIPFLLGIILCTVLTLRFHQKSKRTKAP